MAFYIPLSESWMLIERIMCGYAFLHGIIALIFIFWHNRNGKELSRENDLATPLLRITLLIVIGYILQTLIAAFVVFFEFYPNILKCISWWTMEFASYYIAKFFIWYYSITRLKIVFQGTKFLKYDTNTLKLITFLFLCTAISLSIFCISCCYFYDLIFVSTNNHCAFHAPIWFASIVGIFDSSMGILCYWLFYRKMSVIMAMLNNPRNNNMNITNNNSNSSNIELSQAEKQCDYELAYIVRKFAILSGCTLLTTWIAVGFGMFTQSPLGLFGIDTVINTYCILLYDSRYDHIYQKLFKCISKSQWKSNNNTVSEEVTTPTVTTPTVTTKTGSNKNNKTYVMDKRMSTTTTRSGQRMLRINSVSNEKEMKQEKDIDTNIEMIVDAKSSVSHQ